MPKYRIEITHRPTNSDIPYMACAYDHQNSYVDCAFGKSELEAKGAIESQLKKAQGTVIYNETIEI